MMLERVRVTRDIEYKGRKFRAGTLVSATPSVIDWFVEQAAGERSGPPPTIPARPLRAMTTPATLSPVPADE